VSGHDETRDNGTVTDENVPPGTISKATFSGFPGATLNLEYSEPDMLRTFTR
jgi:hypothetical protein